MFLKLFSFMTGIKSNLMIGAIVALVAALGASTLGLRHLMNNNAELEQEKAILEQSIQSKEAQINLLTRDKLHLDEILKKSSETRAKAEKERNKYQAELRKLRNESKDECLDRDIDANILDKLRNHGNKGS